MRTKTFWLANFSAIFAGFISYEVTSNTSPVEPPMLVVHLYGSWTVLAVWGYDAMPSTRTVDVHIAWLRQKLEENPRHPHFIQTVHGMGYKFAD
ncbi:MAG: helix-turn-helix domain-containing protein [Pyrinomonadaceae bacterium]